MDLMRWCGILDFLSIFFAWCRDDGVTSIVYTDEGGQEQSLVGKIVYTTDESGTGNIIIQVIILPCISKTNS